MMDAVERAASHTQAACQDANDSCEEWHPGSSRAAKAGLCA
jgi:hypothetical protein